MSFGASGGKRSRNGEETPLTHPQRRAPAATTAWEADVFPLNYTCITFMLAQRFCFVKNFLDCELL